MILTYYNIKTLSQLSTEYSVYVKVTGDWEMGTIIFLIITFLLGLIFYIIDSKKHKKLMNSSTVKTLHFDKDETDVD